MVLYSALMNTIVILSAFLSPYRSGAEAMVEEVSIRLGDRYAITIITGRYDRSLPKETVLDGKVRVIRVGFGMKIDKYLFPLLAALEVRKRCPSIVHAVLESYAGMALVLCRYVCPRSKRVLTLQSTNTSLLLGAMHRNAQSMTAISRALVERARRYGRTDVTLIPNGIPRARIQEACRFHHHVEGRVLFVGRLEQMKGVDTLIQAFTIVCAHPTMPSNVHLRIVGQGSHRETLERQTKELGVSDRITFAGYVPSADIYDEYAQAEIFCGLSRSEAMGNVFLEASAAGCAVLATRVGGIPEIIEDQRTGLLVEPDDAAAAAAALKRLLTDADLRMRLSEAATRDKQRYDWGVIAEEYVKIYESL